MLSPYKVAAPNIIRPTCPQGLGRPLTCDVSRSDGSRCRLARSCPDGRSAGTTAPDTDRCPTAARRPPPPAARRPPPAGARVTSHMVRGDVRDLTWPAGRTVAAPAAAAAPTRPLTSAGPVVSARWWPQRCYRLHRLEFGRHGAASTAGARRKRSLAQVS